MKLALIIPVLNQFDLAEVAIAYAINNLSGEVGVEVIALDNGSDKPFEPKIVSNKLKVVVLDKNIGVYPTFWEALKHTDADILAFIHSDLIIEEKGWDERILQEFSSNPKLGLLGFIGSNEIDNSGGRGLGTTSNFQGNIYKRDIIQGGDVMRSWNGSKAEVHGKRAIGYSKGAVVDGCSMVFRRSVLEQIKQREDFPPHHFYDRLLSCETRELGYEVGVLGIACDHISGQTVNQEDAYHEMVKNWCMDNNVRGEIGENWDGRVYHEAERQWLSEYRDKKHFIPCKV